MFDPQYVKPLEMFSVAHIITILVIIALITILFFCRNFFIKNKLADKIFRYTLVVVLLSFEIGYYFYSKYAYREQFSGLLPIPLCGQMLWLTMIALLADSDRIAKLIYPMAMTGATLSIIVVGVEASFPHFRAFDYFVVHAGFMIGILYFFFTRKVNKFTYKDFGWSCLTVFGMSAVVMMFNAFGMEDSYYLMNPPAEDLNFIKDSCGQIGYTILYLLTITCVITIYSLLAIKLTKKRNDDKNIPIFRKNLFLDRLANVDNKKKYIVFALSFFIYIYTISLQAITLSRLLFYFNLILWFVFVGIIVLNEIVHNYKKYKEMDLIIK